MASTKLRASRIGREEPNFDNEFGSFNEWLEWQDDLDILSDSLDNKKTDDNLFKEIVLSSRLKKPYYVIFVS